MCIGGYFPSVFICGFILWLIFKMAKSLSANFLSAANAQETGEVVLVLLTISHAVLALPIRLTSDQVMTVSRGQSYLPSAFSVGRPSDSAEDLPAVQLTIDNVDQVVGDAINAISSSPTVLMEVVLASAPDQVEESLSLTFREARYNANQMTGTLAVEKLEREPFPGDVITPANDPGIF